MQLLMLFKSLAPCRVLESILTLLRGIAMSASSTKMSEPRGVSQQPLKVALKLEETSKAKMLKREKRTPRRLKKIKPRMQSKRLRMRGSRLEMPRSSSKKNIRRIQMILAHTNLEILSSIDLKATQN